MDYIRLDLLKQVAGGLNDLSVDSFKKTLYGLLFLDCLKMLND